MRKDQGGPAFPRPFSRNGDYSDSQKNHSQEGMPLRDYFAAKAMQAMSSNPYYDDHSFAEIAKAAYEQADAMLEERAK